MSLGHTSAEKGKVHPLAQEVQIRQSPSQAELMCFYCPIIDQSIVAFRKRIRSGEIHLMIQISVVSFINLLLDSTKNSQEVF